MEQSRKAEPAYRRHAACPKALSLIPLSSHPHPLSPSPLRSSPSPTTTRSNREPRRSTPRVFHPAHLRLLAALSRVSFGPNNDTKQPVKGWSAKREISISKGNSKRRHTYGLPPVCLAQAKQTGMCVTTCRTCGGETAAAQCGVRQLDTTRIHREITV